MMMMMETRMIMMMTTVDDNDAVSKLYTISINVNKKDKSKR